MSKPKKYLTDVEIEERAVQVLDKYVEGGSERPALPVDIDTLTECDFGFKVIWDEIVDPDGCRTYAALIPTPSDIHPARIILNSRFRSFLESNPEIERLTRGHELCHWIIHVDEGQLKTESLPFEMEEHSLRFHRIQYDNQKLTPDVKNRLAKFAIDDDRAYRVLRPRHAETDLNIEPQWMHRQAEHFSACLLVPRKPLSDFLSNGADPSIYRTHIKLAEAFQVSKRVIQIRLLKLGIIEETIPGKFHNRIPEKRFIF